jgi:hypothetical protein
MKRSRLVDRLWVVVQEHEIGLCGTSSLGEELKAKHVAMEATAKRDVADRLRTLAASLSIGSDKTWLMRRAKQLEHDAASLEVEALALAGSQSSDRS